MIEQQGRVVNIQPGHVQVEVGPAAGCSQCEAGQGCGAGLFVRLLNKSPVRLQINSGLPVERGDVVTVGIPESVFLRWVLGLYGFPLLSAFASAAPTQYLAAQAGLGGPQTDLAVLCAAAAGFLLMLRWMRRSRAFIAPGTALRLSYNRPSPGSTHCAAMD